eukprot:403339921
MEETNDIADHQQEEDHVIENNLDDNLNNQEIQSVEISKNISDTSHSTNIAQEKKLVSFQDRIGLELIKLQQEFQEYKKKQDMSLPDLTFEKYMIISEQSVQQILDQFRLTFQKNKINDQTLNQILKLHFNIEFSLAKKIMNVREKEIFQKFRMDNLRFLYWLIKHLRNGHEWQGQDYENQVIKMLYDYKQEQSTSYGPKGARDIDRVDDGGLNLFRDQLNDQMKRLFPNIQKPKQLILKSEEDRKREGEIVSEMIKQTKYLPEEEGIKYHIISQLWFNKWLQYTFQEIPNMIGDTQIEDQMTTLKLEDDKTEQEEVQKDANINHPGPINSLEDLKEITVQDQFLQLKSENQEQEFQIKQTCLEGKDFLIVSDDVWNYLFAVYEGNDIPRYSINLLKHQSCSDKDSQSEKKELIIEIFNKKVQIYILPKMRSHQYLKVAAALYISRLANVKDLREKIASILKESSNEQRSKQELLDISRLWKLDPHESVFEVEKYYDIETRESLPLHIDGQILQDSQNLEDINISDQDVLLYEVQSAFFLPKNNKFAFIPKEKKEKQIKIKNFLKNQNDENLSESQLMKLPLQDCLNQKSNGGLTGLQNLGNTCYMNSVLQCLSNTEPLAKYLIFDCYTSHINRNNPLGTQGKLAIAFSELLYELYVGQENHVAPWDVKNIISRRAVQFSGFAQHDSQEMLSFLLETLHEDLNDIVKKPYIEYKDFDNRKDEDVANEYWEGFKQREKSVLVDLFYGQLKSRVQCTVCGKISISFDPFNMLSVPIPQIKDSFVNVRYFPYDLKEQHKILRINVGEYESLSELNLKILEATGKISAEEVFVGIMQKRDKIDVFGKENFIKKVLDKNYEIVAYERPLALLQQERHFLVEIKLYHLKRNWMLITQPTPLNYARLLCMNPKMSVREMKLEIYRFFRPYVKTDELNQVFKRESQYWSESVRIEKEYQWFFENKSNRGNHPYDLFINNNMKKEEGLLWGYSQERCEFCNKHHKDQNCAFDLLDNKSLRQITDSMREKRDLELVIIFNHNQYVDVQELQEQQFVNVDSAPQQQFKKYPTAIKDAISLYDCINWFSQEELLTGNDKWYCSHCKNHQNALKKMEIFKAPEYLIIHLKRFSHQRAYSARKIEDVIEFPIEDLDLNEHCLGNKLLLSNPKDKSKAQKSLKYDLYAVSNHYGSLHGGHYTAFAQNPITSKWYEFDDSHVTEIGDVRRLVNKAGYVLFYKRRH